MAHRGCLVGMTSHTPLVPTTGLLPAAAPAMAPGAAALTSPTPRVVAIDTRLNGPRRSANGGIAAGTFAALAGGTARVRLHRPVPVGRQLGVVAGAGRDLRVVDRRGDVASVTPVAAFEVHPHVTPTLDDALEARRAHPLLGVRHPFSDCVVCSPERPDGMGVVWGPMRGRPDILLAPFLPTTRDAVDGVVRPSAVWAALDCPGYPAALLARRRLALLGTLAAHRLRDVRVGERLVVVGWSLAHQGRVHETATALLDESGALVASARATWVELRHQRLARVAARLA